MARIKRLLIANRGEIACRIMDTARRLGIHSIALYSDADQAARHRRMADSAVHIGPAPAAQSYLRMDAIIAAARRSGADAVHPGYGFLSENADFCRRVQDAGLIFVGPPPAAIEAMGDKARARTIMERAGVPLLPGYEGASQDADDLRLAAAEIGYPVLLKAAAGGGGKGMRPVHTDADFAEALAAARREAAAAFGDDRMILERYLERPRHIEIQVFMDAHGNGLHLFERDCSLQRRHQKVIEEAPAPRFSERLRRQMGRAALEAARAVDYCGAGTVEFLLSGGGFYFMEMNTRLQVEHPVTEMITGQDLVQWQLAVACGEALPLRQEQLQINGHAVEARIYAEDADNGFLPSTGTLHRWHWRAAEGLRLDSGVEQGDEVSRHYDPMLAKLVAHGPDRASACKRLAQGLAAMQVSGPVCNLGFLQRLVSAPAFVAARLHTGFIEQHGESLHPSSQKRMLPVLLAALALCRPAMAPAPGPFGRAWWRQGGAPVRLWMRALGDDWPCMVERLEDGGWAFEVAGRRTLMRATMEPAADGDGGTLVVETGGAERKYAVYRHADGLQLASPDGRWDCAPSPPPRAAAAAGDGGSEVLAPMPGKVVQIAAVAGESVAGGQMLMTLEAMKMEHPLRAPRDAVVAALHCTVGDSVAAGACLISLKDPD